MNVVLLRDATVTQNMTQMVTKSTQSVSSMFHVRCVLELWSIGWTCWCFVAICFLSISRPHEQHTLTIDLRIWRRCDSENLFICKPYQCHRVLSVTFQKLLQSDANLLDAVSSGLRAFETFQRQIFVDNSIELSDTPVLQCNLPFCRWMMCCGFVYVTYDEVFNRIDVLRRAQWTSSAATNLPFHSTRLTRSFSTNLLFQFWSGNSFTNFLHGNYNFM